MIKVSMLATLLAGLAMGGNIVVDSRPQKAPELRDTKIIVEVDRSLESLTEEGVRNVQSTVYNNIKRYVTPNIKFVTSYSVLNNAFAISINSKYVESVKTLPGVKSVTVNKLRFVTQSVDRAPAPETPDPVNDYGGKTNQSAVTMNYDPYTNDTNAGEGTVIAVLDNEFYFRAKNSENNGFLHETFTDFKSTENVKVRWTERPDISKTHAYSPEDNDDDNEAWHAIVDAAKMGEEGSLYFNQKVPFYFDYGGDPEHTGADPEHDFDVSSTRDYHGSHVASIAAGHSPYYYGIAPKAQIVAMKVFTNFKASKTDQALGFSGQSGAYDIPLLNALEDCITLGVDGINMSLGSDLDDFDAESISMRTLTKLKDAGILSSISAGNSGKTSYAFAGGYQNWTSEMVETGILGGYANQVDSMSIASAQPGRTFYTSAFRMNGQNIAYQDQVVNVGSSLDYEEEEEHRISDLIETHGNNIQWEYIPGYGASTDYGVGADKKNVDGKIAIVNRGSIDFATKVQTAVEKDAIGVVIINNDPTASDFNFRCSFGDYKPPIPVALVLMKDKATFEQNTESVKTFEIVKNEVDDNPKANTLSDFSSDGAMFNLDLKPEIAAPGDSIRGAVPPQTKDDRNLRPYSTYEFLSGTSMSAPNYAGAQSVVLSKKAVSLKDKPEELKAYKDTVDMRLMSTAVPMKDYNIAPEINPSYPLETIENQHTPGKPEDGYYGYEASPRIQGAGMANLGNAYKTDVYLEGLDLQGNPIGKSKIALRNNDKINKGTVSLSFLAHNESSAEKKYMASFSVMRPAIKASNEIVSRKYNYVGEKDTYTSIPGLTWYSEKVIDEHTVEYQEENTMGEVAVGDVFKVTKELKYNYLHVDPQTGEESLEERKIEIGRYCCTAVRTEEHVVDPAKPDETETWVYATYETLESSNYQSTQDTKLVETTPVEITVKANGTTSITLPEYNLTEAQKADILEFYSYGTYLEGFVTLTSENGDNINLSMPWMGFFAGEGKSYDDAPVVEPFGFEKDATSIYPSELVNDIGYSLINKTNIDMGSSWVTTYVEPGKSYNSDAILRNDQSLTSLAKTNPDVHLLGTDSTGKYYENAKDHLYVGNPLSSNTMIVQQFMLRSVDDNYYTIKNKGNGQVVAKDVLEDMLFGSRYGRYPLYKSHVDGGYLSGGYVAHRAWGVIPLYDQITGAPFAAGEYEITFNYLLAGTSKWISKSYTLHVASEEPSITGVSVLSDSVRFHYNDKNISSISVGIKAYEPSQEELAGQYIELSKDRIDQEIQNNWNRSWMSGRLYIELNNKAYGRTGIVIRFEQNDDGENIYNQYTIVEHYSFDYSTDFEDLGNEIKYATVEGSKVTYISVDGYVRVKRYNDPVPSSGGCGGNIATTSILLASLAGALAILIAFARKRRKLGGKE